MSFLGLFTRAFSPRLSLRKSLHFQIVRVFSISKLRKNSINNDNDTNIDPEASKFILADSYTDERKFQTLSTSMFSKLYESRKDSTDIRSTIDHIIHLYEREKYTEQMHVPTTLTLKDMEDLIRVYPDEKELLRSLKFFFTRECKRINDTKRTLNKKLERDAAKKVKYNNKVEDWQLGIFNDNGDLEYGLWHNSLLSRITKQSVRDYRHKWLLRQSAMFGQKLIIDLDYDEYMKLYEARLLAQQIGILYYENRANKEMNKVLPFDIHFTNCTKATNTLPALSKHIKRFDELSSYFHHKSFIDYPELFPRKHLVYLSPHATKSLKTYSHEDIYIIGGYNDRTSHVCASNVKAEKADIRCYRLPLDEFVRWKQGNKNLCLNQVVMILQAMKQTNDWRYAISNFAPQRKLKSNEEKKLEDEIRVRAVAKRMRSIQKSYKM
ncbi:tRNA methyltransferase 10 C [Blomia tropicalis]|nr:tRNA methyltransferase 10 C [Blomia tropicalis]